MRHRRSIRTFVYSTFVILAAALSIIYCVRGGRLVHVASASAQEPLWQEITSGSLDALKSGQSELAPERYKAFQLNEAALANLLANTPMEFIEAAKDPQNEITLPMPDGAFARFRFVESPIMAPELAARFPEIKTYRGWGVDDPTATMRFDRNSKGFHAFVLSPKGAFYITPLTDGDTRNYASYFTRDAGGNGAECLVDSDNRPTTMTDLSALDQSSIRPASTNGAPLRTFRLAVAATGEYTVASGGTVDGAMMKIETTINSVNVIYEAELAIRLTLIANNDSIVFTDPATDQYTSGNASQLLEENQQRLDDLIGEGNYDIGHVFDVTSGNGTGTAWRGVVCNNGEKARGTTLCLTPGGTVFVLPVAHEIGHQFGADHTFNGTAGSCSGQVNNDTAYEPGSGSTIMSYAGRCNSDNIQTFTSQYFHWQSLAAMAEYLDNNGGCATTTNNNNTPPTVTPPLPSAGHYFIPSGTPFTLTADPSTDAEDSTLTYCWEEADNGSPGPPNEDRGDNPLFRSFPPTPDRSRTFPKMADLLSGNPTPGETLPATDRWLNFVVTVRDNHSPGGGFNQGAVLVNVCWHAMPFAVTAPAAGTQALEGSSLTVTWNLAFTNVQPINTSNVRILLSTDPGNTVWTTLEPNTSNDGSQTVTIPRANTQEARIKVEAFGNIFFNVSPAFTIIPKPTIAATGSLTVTKGGPSVTAPVATVADGRDTAGSLGVVVTTNPLPTGLTLETPTNNGGVVRVTATAQCNAFATTRAITLEVTNNAGLTARTTFNLVVAPNPPPILGDYSNATVIAGQLVSVSPSAPPSDPNGNLVSVTPSIVVPTPVPGNATLWAVEGVVNISTSRTMRLGVHQVQVEATDSCFDRVTKEFFLTVVNSPPQITSVGNSVRTTRGGLPAPPSIRVATVSDQQDAPGALQISATAPVAGLTISVTNSAGTIMATATATCAVAPGAYTGTLTVTDSSRATASATFTIFVDPNIPPTMGTYLDSGVTVGGQVLIVPSAAPSDPNNNTNNAVALTVDPVILDGGGQVTVQSNGRVHVNTVAQTTIRPYGVTVTARDSCGALVSRTFRLTVRSATCVAEQSAVFIADTGNHRIQRFSGVTWNVIGAGTQGSGSGQFSSPESVVASPDGRKIYVADTGNSRIQWSQDSGGTWAVFAMQLVPKGLVLDRDGNLYVSDAQTNRVVRYPGGVPGAPIVLAASGSGAGRVSNPNGLAIDCRMSLYIADTGNNRILVIATADSAVLANTGTVVASSGAGLNPAQVTAPQGVAVDNSGNLYVADTGNDRVLRFAQAPLPGPAVALCTFGPALGQVSGPEGLTIAALVAGPLAGVPSIIVSDTINNRIQARSLPAGAWMLPPPPVGNGLGSGIGQFNLPSKIR